MKKSLISAIAAVAVAALVVLGLGIASDWFTNWNVKTWFNNWGAKTEVIDENTETSNAANMSRIALNAVLNHDSDEAETEATVVGYSAPTIMSYTAYGANGGNPTVKVGIDYSGSYPATPPSPLTITVNVYTWNYSGLSLATTTTCELGLHTSGDSGYYGLVDVTNFYSYYIDTNQPHPNYYILGFQTPAGNKAASEEKICVFVYDMGNSREFGYSDGEFSFRSRMLEGALGVRCYDGVDSASAENMSMFYSVNSVANDFSVEFDLNNYGKFGITEIPFLREHVGYFTVELFNNSVPNIPNATVMYISCEPNELPHITYEVKKLPTPTNVTYDNGVLTWNAVTGADGYMVFWNNEQSEILTTPEFDIFAAGISAGEYTFRVRAIGNMDMAFASVDSRSVTAYNAGSTITRVVALNLCIDGDTITKLVPYNGNINDYLHDVEIAGSLFGGWYYDSGFSNPVGENDIIVGDTTVYARLSDKPTDTATWWDINKWYVLGSVIGVVALAIVVGTVLIVVKRRRDSV